jgi:TctA family transporter
MLDAFSNLFAGLSVALQFQNILYCFSGALIGTLIGVLPGLGPVATIAILLPVTFYLPPVAALVMLAGIRSALAPVWWRGWPDLKRPTTPARKLLSCPC